MAPDERTASLLGNPSLQRTFVSTCFLAVMFFGALRGAVSAQSTSPGPPPGGLEPTATDAKAATAKTEQGKLGPAHPLHVVPFVESGTPTDAGLSAIAGASMIYFGGPVISNVHVVQVLYGTGAYLPQVSSTAAPSVASFFADITQSAYFDMLNEYSTAGVLAADGTPGTSQTIGHGLFDGQFTITPSPANDGATITDGQIQAELLSQVAAGGLPAPALDSRGNNNTLYMIYFPPGKTIQLGNMLSCARGSFCAYHNSTVGTFSSRRLYYGVMPDMQPPSGCSTGCERGGLPFAVVTSVSSHELSEAVTDPDVGAPSSVARALAWVDPFHNDEIGDICNGQLATVTANGTAYQVQQEFSNFQNDCVAVPPNFTFTGPGASATLGTEFESTVALMEDQVVTFQGTYTGTVHFTSTDPSAVLPPDYTFNPADLASHQFVFTLNTQGLQTITATDPKRPGVSGNTQITVNAKTVRLRLAAPQTAKSGVSTTVVATAVDQDGNPAATFTKPVHFTSSDLKATLPADMALVNGTGSFSVTFNTAGSATLTVMEAGNGTNFAQVSLSILTPGSTSTTTTFTGAAMSTFGQAVPYTATVVPATGGSATFLGTPVTFISDGNSLGSANVDSTGHAPPVSVLLQGGAHTVFAEFSGDTSHQSSSSTPLAVMVNPAATTVTVMSSQSPSTFGANVIFTAAVASPAANAIPGFHPTGSLITFNDGAVPLGVVTAPVPGSSVTFSTSSLTPGSHSITASYSGNSSFAASSSAAFVQTVNPATADYSITPDKTTATILAGQSVTFTIATKSLNFFAGIVQFSCGNLPPLTTCKLSSTDTVVDGAEPQSFTTVTIQTTGPHASLNLQRQDGLMNAGLWAVGVFGLGIVLLAGAAPRKRRIMGATLLALTMLAVLTSCGGGSSNPPPGPTPTPTPPPATPAGTYSITVSASGAAKSGPNPATPNQQLSVSVTVQP